MTRAADLAKLIAGSSTLGGTGELVLKDVDTADGSSPKITFQTGDTDIAQDDVLGTIDFQAPDEGTGTDAILVSAGVEAKAEGDFSSSSNATSLVFKTGSSAAAEEKVRLTSAGRLGVGVTSPNAKLSVSGTGTVDLGIGSTNAGGAYLYLDGDSNGDFSGSDYSYIGHDTSGQLLIHQDSPSGSDNILLKTNGSTRWTLNSSGNLFPAATTQGIVLGATSDTAANRLEDYEEGTFTPTLIDGAGSSRTVSNAYGRYRKIGTIVNIQASLTRNDTGGTSGNLAIGNIPFTSTYTPAAFYINGGMWADEGGPTTNNSDSVGVVYFGGNSTSVQGLKATNDARPADHRYFRYEQITNGRPVYVDCTFVTS